MPDGKDDDVMRRLHDRAEEMKRDGGLSPTLAIQLLSDLTIVSDRLTNADMQRHALDAKLDKVLAEQHRVALLAQDVKAATSEIAHMRLDITENTEFRLRFLGGSTVARMFYAAGGAILAVIVQYILTRVK